MNKKILSIMMAGILLLNVPVFAVSISEVGDISEMASVSDSTVSYPIFVIGRAAKPEDVAAALNVALGLAAGLTTEETVDIPGTSVEAVTGGAKIATAGTFLTPYMNPQDVKSIYTESDIPSILATKTFSTTSGGYQYKQYLYLGGENPNPSMAKIVFDKPTNENVPRIAFKLPANQILYKYKMTFSTPVSLSGVTDQPSLDQLLQGATINLLGKDFVISSLTYGGGSTPVQDMTLLGGRNVVSISTDASKTVTLDSKGYIITLSAVGKETIGGKEYLSAIGDVNGESFQMRAGDTRTLADGTKIAIIKVFQGKTGTADFVTMTIGVNEVKVSASGTVTRGTASISELTSEITQTSTGWSALGITYKPGQDDWMDVGESLEDLFVSAFNIKFNSIFPQFTDSVNRQAVTFTPSGYNMMLSYRNAVGNDRQMHTLYYKGGQFYWASADFSSLTNSDNLMRDVIFDESKNISAIDQDYFVIQKAGFSHVIQFTSLTPSSKQMTFLDEAGNSITATYDTSYVGYLIIDGTSYKINVVDETKKIVRIDLNGNSNIASSAGEEYSYLVPKLVTAGQGGIYFYKGSQTVAPTTSGVYADIGLLGFKLINDTLTAGHVEVAGHSIGTFTSGTVSNIIGNQYTGYMDVIVNCDASLNCNIGLGTVSTGMQINRGFVLVEEALQGGTTHNWIYFPVQWDSGNTRTYIGTPVSSDSNYKNIALIGSTSEYRGMTTYGTYVTYITSTGGGSATSSYPDSFIYANIYILGPDGKVTSGTTAGTVTTQTYHPVLTDAVKLDDEVTTSDKNNYDLVVVGGPCVNKLAADVLGKTYPACGADSGITTDKGLIQVFDDQYVVGKSVLLIAGWEAEHTDLACQLVQRGLPGATTTQKEKSVLTVSGTVSSPVYS